MSEISRIGLDTSKHVFEVHGVDAAGRVVLRRQLKRHQVVPFFAGLAPCVVGLEACGAAHHWARLVRGCGHEVRLMPPHYVKAYVKRGKSDRIDAEAACEAVGRPSMRFVPMKSEAEQADQMLLRVRDLLIKQRTMLVNAIRGHAAEFGVVAGKGVGRIGEVLERARAALPAAALELLELLAGQLAALAARLAAVERRLMAVFRRSARARRLAAIPGVGPITAVTLALKVADAGAFRSGRHFAAYLGLTPREHSTAGRQRLGGISREGDETMRRLLVVGAMAVVKVAAGRGRGSPWLVALLARKPRKLAAAALANKTARIAWAMLASGAPYRPGARRREASAGGAGLQGLPQPA